MWRLQRVVTSPLMKKHLIAIIVAHHFRFFWERYGVFSTGLLQLQMEKHLIAIFVAILFLIHF